MTRLIKLSERFSETTVDDEVVVMDLATGDFFSLKDTAKAIWDYIDGSRGRETLIDDLARDYGVEAGQITPQVDAFLGSLDGAGLLARG